MNAKIYYRQAEQWLAAKTVEQTILAATYAMEHATIIYMQSITEKQMHLKEINRHIDRIAESDTEFYDKTIPNSLGKASDAFADLFSGIARGTKSSSDFFAAFGQSRGMGSDVARRRFSPKDKNSWKRNGLQRL